MESRDKMPWFVTGTVGHEIQYSCWLSDIPCPACANYNLATNGKDSWCVQRGCDYTTAPKIEVVKAKNVKNGKISSS